MDLLRYSITILFLVSVFPTDGVRVCESWLEYLNPVSGRCFDNPDGEPANVTQILHRWGCTVEEYQLLTKDGYYILVVRAFMGSPKNQTPIIMGHGIFMNSLGFVVMFNKSTAYQLIKKGYEVFFVNFRGTRYSTGHKTLTQKDEGYWKFSFHEMAEFDLPAVMDLVKKKTDGLKVIYIGYSMGTTVINIYCILYPVEASERLRGVIELAPVANLSHVRSALGILAPTWPIIKPLANLIWHGRLLPRNPIRSAFCSRHIIGILLCYTVTTFMYGRNYHSPDPLRQPVVFQQNPDVIPATVVEHYYQIIKSNQFHYFDYGSKRNMKKYGSSTPPIYDFSKISVPITLFVGLNDYLAEAKNSQLLYNNLPRVSRCGLKTMPDPQWTHTCFIMSKDMHLYLNGAIHDTISRMESNSCLP